MTTNNQRTSATIIPFPARARAIGGGHRDETHSAVRHDAPRYAVTASGGAWYHEAAIIEDADEARKR